MGSATAWQLSQAGENVTLIEQQSEVYSSGSSYGEARICRSLGPKNNIWSYLHDRGVAETKALIDFLNQEDSGSHHMEDVYTDSPVTYIIYSDKGEAAERILRQLPYRYKAAYNPEEAHEVFGVNTPKDRIIIQEYARYSGTMNPSALIQKMQRGVELKGNSILYNHRVERLIYQDGVYRAELVNTETGTQETITAEKIVSAAGPYTGELLKELAPKISKSITPKRVALGFFKISEEKYQSYSGELKQKIHNFFPLIDLGPNYIYSMIEKHDANGNPLFKVGGHYRRDDIGDLDNVWKIELNEEEIAWNKQQLLDYFQFFNVPLDPKDLIYQSGYSCVYSLTESEIPILDHISGDPNAVFLGGMSGVGAKGSLAYGKIASNMLLGKDEDDFMYQKVKRKLSLK